MKKEIIAELKLSPYYESDELIQYFRTSTKNKVERWVQLAREHGVVHAANVIGDEYEKHLEDEIAHIFHC